MKSWALVGLFFISAGCNYNNPKDQGDNAQMISSNADFAVIQTKIIQPYCLMCHSSAGGNAGGINVENYANVMHYIDRIQDSVAIHQTMPPGKPVSKKLRQLLVTWISNGSPEHATPGTPATEPTEPPTPSEPLQPTFSSISKNIFAPKCVMCHGPGGSAENLPVTDYNFLLKSMWIVPNDLGQSSLYDSVKSGRMPPGGNLTKAEIDVIGAWITDGAKNN